jgi:soluble lytic murein transglycosylase-like protein
VIYRADMVVAAGKYGLDPDLVQGLAEQESNYRAWAYNPEPRYKYLWDVKRGRPFRALTPIEVVSKFPPKDFPAPVGTDPDQEFWAQQASWGLLQVMGAVARQMGFVGPFLTELCTVPINLDLGCAYLGSLLRQMSERAAAGISKPVVIASALAAWNGGPAGNAPDAIADRNHAYAAEVLARAERIKTKGQP